MRKNSPKVAGPENELPLAPATFHILLALVGHERHGYAVMQDVAQRTEGTVRIGPGTVYGALKRLVEAGWIEEVGERVDAELDNERRRYYRLTKRGLAIARAEARRLNELVQFARERRLISPETA